MKRILLTGFEPFQGETINPSQELAKAFEKSKLCDSLVLPVSYQRSIDELRSLFQLEDYDFVLMLGQAGGRKWIDLERVAINLQDSLTPDEDQDQRLQKKISLEGPDAFMNPLPLRDWAQALQKKGLPVEISFSAGAFVCNSVYYQVFEWMKFQARPTQALFVHVPYIQEQMMGKPEDTPFLSFAMMKKTIEELITLIQQQAEIDF